MWNINLNRKILIVLFFALIIVFLAQLLISIRKEHLNNQERLIMNAESFSLLSSNSIISYYIRYSDSGLFKLNELLLKITELNTDLVKIQIVSIDGKVLFDFNSEKYSDRLKSQQNLYITKEEDLKKIRDIEISINPEVYIGEDRFLEVVQPHIEEWGQRNYSIRYYFTYDSIYNNLISLFRENIITAVIFLIISSVFVSFTINYFVKRPLERMIEMTNMIAKEKYSYRVDIKTNDEIGKLAKSFNEMAGKLYVSRKELKKYSKKLELEVMKRTKELNKRVKQLEKFNKVAVGRELRMIELKKENREIKKLLRLERELKSINNK